ncbi:hypothetical protein [Spirosoma pollinicola]|uniref:Uncharacterized protein n=1 Tax=Spirosoma pollinicola TaxID=2057025 RepID=A0A2K8YZ71_9BACT|nr:hypothetical protein [Spirosoma pollinicola]AUD02901.1 hypothetical protein CWM47_14295 [Spirosoma pollinicola]
MNPLPANIPLLVNIAKETGHTYADAFAVWQVCNHQKDAYLIVDTVLWIARRHNIAVMAAFDLYKGIEDQFGQL